MAVCPCDAIHLEGMVSHALSPVLSIEMSAERFLTLMEQRRFWQSDALAG